MSVRPPLRASVRLVPLVALLVALLVASLAGQAGAQAPVEGPCPPTCAGTGRETYANVWFVGEGNGDVYRVAPPFALDRSSTTVAGSSRGIVDLRTGTLKARTTSASTLGPGVMVQGVDRFTVGGVAAGTPVTLRAWLVADGVGRIPHSGSSVQTSIQLGMPGSISAFQARSYQAIAGGAPHQVAADTPFDILLQAQLDFTVVAGTPFDFYYSLRLQSGNGVGNDLDFMNTAHFGFEAAPGVRITSVGGFSSSATTVPEPATVLLMGGGLLGVAAIGRRRARQTV